MRIAIVVIRYGLEIVGGGELVARMLAERLRHYFDVEVLTTCATDLMTWRNHYRPGLDTLNGVPVRRFSVAHTRDMAEFNAYSAQIMLNPRTLYDEAHWMYLQGPHTPELTRYIREHEQAYDLFIFVSYLYATTYANIHLVPHKSILLPTAHDEQWLYMDLFRGIFNLPRGLLFLSDEEARLVHRVFHNASIHSAVVGVGIDIPPIPPVNVPFQDYILYMGRIDESKKCDELIQYFLRYKAVTHDPLKLVLIGATGMAIPSHPDIRVLGFLQDNRFAWLRQAQLLVMPSHYESFSLVTLEAWALGVPTLVNGLCEVLKGHCQRGNGGLYYENEAEFIEALALLRARADLRVQLGKQGQAYVHERYDWQRVEQAYVHFLRNIYTSIYPERASEVAPAKELANA